MGHIKVPKGVDLEVKSQRKPNKKINKLVGECIQEYKKRHPKTIEKARKQFAEIMNLPKQ